MEVTDEKLYYQFMEHGDESALGLLMDRHKESLTLFLYSYVHNMDDAEDLMLESFAAAVTGRSRYIDRGEGSFKTWLFTIGRNQAITFLRKKKRILLPLEDRFEPGESMPAPDLEILKKESDRQLYAAMQELAPEYRQVLYLLYIEQLRHNEIAVVMKKNKKQVYNLVARGRLALRQQLERMGFDCEQY